MTEGKAGIIILNNLLPKDVQFDARKPVDSKTFKNHMVRFAKKYPQDFAQKISKIATLGEHIAYSIGANVGPKDLKLDKKKNKKFIDGIQKRLDLAKSENEKRDILLKGLGEATNIALGANKETNDMVQQVMSGARGKPAQLARMSVSPVYAVDMNQMPKTNLIRNNFTGGLTPQEFFNVSSQGRFSSVQSANATSEPGALGKIVIANAEGERISVHDCGTTNGEYKSRSDKHIIGHFTAGSNGELITRDFLKKNRSPMLKVRTPITCKAHKGICSKCYGLKTNGKLPSIGDEVGIVGGQNLAEIMVQMTLSTKHSTIGKNKSDELTGVDGFKVIANSPSSFQGSATVADKSGVVKKIEKAPHGGNYIYVDSKKYYVKPNLKPSVKQGDRVSKGDRLSSGLITPKQASTLWGINEGRSHHSELLHDLFKRSTGKDIMKKHFNVISKAQMSLVKDQYGDISSKQEEEAKYPKNESAIMLSSVKAGMYLARDEGSISKGTELTRRVIEKLKLWNVKKIWVTQEKPPFKHEFKSLEQRPTFSGNLFQKMNYRNVAKAIQQDITSGKIGQNINKSNSSRSEYSSGMI